MAFLILVVGIAVVITLAVQGRRERNPDKEKMTTGQAIGLGIAIVVGALGLVIVGGGILLALAMSSYGSNK